MAETITSPKLGLETGNRETWKQRDMRKMIEENKVAYEKAMAEYERHGHREKSLVPMIESSSIKPTNADMLNTILELKKRLEGESGQKVGESTFTKRLEAESKQKHYNFNSFDGMGDSEEHLSYFDQLDLHYKYNDLTRCHFFAANFRSGAQRWFCRLPARSIDTWLEFKKLFLNKFKVNQQHEVHTIFLETIAQRNGELL